jgi:hypothetical protein
MNAAAGAVPGSYARAIERLWIELCERPVIISKRDWKLIEEWYERGIPLQVVEEAIAAAAERRTKGKPTDPPRGLAYISQAVDEGWMAVLAGRSASRDEAGGLADEPGRAPIAGWRERRDLEGEPSALGALLAELIEAFERGEDEAALDESLDARLPEVAPREMLREIERELERELARHKDRMAPGVYEMTLKRASALRLRERLRLDKLSKR